MSKNQFKQLTGGVEMNLSEKHLAYWAYHPATTEDEQVIASQAGEGNTIIDDTQAGNTYNSGGTDGAATNVLASGVGPVLEADDPENYSYVFKDSDPKWY